MERFEQKKGVGNAFINWRRFEESLLRLALERIPTHHLCAVFDRISRDVRENTSGFPDLVIFPEIGEMGDYSLVEVKGPGDQLQKNQQRWMKLFQKVGIPYSLLWVDYR